MSVASSTFSILSLEIWATIFPVRQTSRHMAKTRRQNFKIREKH
jgi:hypothetical protein